MLTQPDDHLRSLVTSEVVPHQQDPQWRELFGQGEAHRQAVLPRLPEPAGHRGIARDLCRWQRRHDLLQGLAQPSVQDRIGSAGDRPDTHLARSGMEQGQDLDCALPHILMRLRGGPTLRLPMAAGMGDGLKRPGLVLAPDRQAHRPAERVSLFDQLFLPRHRDQ